MLRIAALGRLRQKNHKFKTSLGYIEDPYLKKKTLVISLTLRK
jgi:hypothetical protein